MAGHHVVSWRVYVVIFLALAVLTVVTVQAAGHDFGPFNTVVALGIAAVKATLVMLFFMHVRYSPRLTTLVLFSGFVFLGDPHPLHRLRLHQPALAHHPRRLR